MATKDILSHFFSSVTKTPIQFSPDGWPLNSTGQPYTRDEIVVNPAIPYPQHVDPARPGPYWRRRTPAELSAEKSQIEKKSKAREKARAKLRQSNRRRTLSSTVPFSSSFETQATRTGRATADMVERVNTKEAEARFVNGFLRVF